MSKKILLPSYLLSVLLLANYSTHAFAAEEQFQGSQYFCGGADDGELPRQKTKAEIREQQRKAKKAMKACSRKGKAAEPVLSKAELIIRKNTARRAAQEQRERDDACAGGGGAAAVELPSCSDEDGDDGYPDSKAEEVQEQIAINRISVEDSTFEFDDKIFVFTPSAARHLAKFGADRTRVEKLIESNRYQILKPTKWLRRSIITYQEQKDKTRKGVITIYIEKAYMADVPVVLRRSSDLRYCIYRVKCE